MVRANLEIKNIDILFRLVKALDLLDSVKRFRISSIEPNLLSNEIISFISSSKNFVPHFHILYKVEATKF